MSSFARSVSDHLRKPGGGIYGWMVKRIFKKWNRPLERLAVTHCKIQPNDSVLELGFGPGFGIQYAAELVKNGNGKVYGMDFSPAMMTEAMNLLKEEISSNKVQLTLGNVSDLPYRDESIDKVFHCNCYYFWDDRQKVLNNIHRVLRPGGFMITVLNKSALAKLNERDILSKEQTDHERYMDELENHFHDIDINDFNCTNSEKTCQKSYFKKEYRIAIERNAVIHCKIQPNESVLELGFGPGFGIQYAAELVKNGNGKVYGMDFSPAMITEAMNLLKEEISSNKVQLTLGNVSDLPYRDESIDKVLNKTTLERAIKRGFLTKEQVDPERYMDELRQSYFCNVDINDFNFTNSEGRYQVIHAIKSIQK